jgi:hypothetical protein
MTRFERNADNFGADGFELQLDGVTVGICRARRRGRRIADDVNVGSKRGQPIGVAGRIEFECEVDGGKSSENFGTFGGRGDGTGRTLGLVASGADDGIAENADHDNLGERVRLLEETNVAGMKEVEGAGGERRLKPLALPCGAKLKQLFARNHLTHFPAPRIESEDNSDWRILSRALEAPSKG